MKKGYSPLNSFLIRQKNVVFAYLFGSHAQQQAGPLSDVDLAFYFKNNLNADQRFDLRLEYIKRCKEFFETEKIDLIVLNDSPLPLQYSVVARGKIIFERNKKERVEFEVKTMSMFFDRQYYEKRHMEHHLSVVAEKGVL